MYFSAHSSGMALYSTLPVVKSTWAIRFAYPPSIFYFSFICHYVRKCVPAIKFFPGKGLYLGISPPFYQVQLKKQIQLLNLLAENKFFAQSESSLFSPDVILMVIQRKINFKFFLNGGINSNRPLRALDDALRPQAAPTGWKFISQAVLFVLLRESQPPQKVHGANPNPWTFSRYAI